MAKTKVQKQEAVKDFIEKLKKAKSLVFVNFDNLKVKEIEELRKNCRAENVDYLVAKKTLMKIGFKKAGIANTDPKTFAKGVATVFGYEDEVTPARIIQAFAKDHEALNTIGGVLEGKFVGPEKVIELSSLPSRDELLAKLVGSINAPISGFVNALVKIGRA